MEKTEIQAYMEAAKRHRLLTREEEVELAQIVQRGRVAREGLKAGKDSMPRERWRELNTEVHRGEEARKRFLEANLRLVISLANHSFYRNAQIPLADLVQEGNIGLMRALDKFDPSRGFRFSTYAAWWIRQAFTRSLQVNDQIRIPTNRGEVRSKVLRAYRWLEAQEGKTPTMGEVAAWVDVPVHVVKRTLELPYVGASLDEPLSEDGDATLLGNMIEDESTEDSEATAVLHDFYEKKPLLFDGLSERDREIMDFRFTDGMSLEEIGDKAGVSRERVRQILARCMALVRQRAKDLKF